MAFRLLAEMRIDAFRKLDALAPAYLVRRRTGDLMALATHDIELVEYFFAHTVAPAFVAILVPAAVLAALAWASGWLALALLPFLLAVGLSPFLMRKRVDRLGSRGARGGGRARRLRRRTRCRAWARSSPSSRKSRRGDKLERALAAPHRPAPAVLPRAHPAARHPRGADRPRRPRRRRHRRACCRRSGTIDPGLLPLLTILAMAAFLPVSEIAQIGRQLADTLGATRRVYALANEPIPVRDGPGVAGQDGRGGAGARRRELHLSRPDAPRADATSASPSPPARRWRWSALRAPARPRRRNC